MGGQRVLGAIPSMTKLAHVQRVRLLVLVLEMSLQRVVARECPTAVRTLLRFVDASAGRWWHSELTAVIAANSSTVRRGGR